MSDDIKKPNDQHRFEQLLPFYINNKLSAEDAAFVRSYIASNPDAKKAVHFTEQLSRIIRNIGINRNPEAALTRLSANFRPRKRASLIIKLLGKLKSLGISAPLALALLVIVGQVGYTAHKMNWFGDSRESILSNASPHLTVTLKRGADAGALAAIIEKFGGQIVHSTVGGNAENVFISVMDKSKIQGLIDALMDSGLIESAAVLL